MDQNENGIFAHLNSSHADDPLHEADITTSETKEQDVRFAIFTLKREYPVYCSPESPRIYVLTLNTYRQTEGIPEALFKTPPPGTLINSGDRSWIKKAATVAAKQIATDTPHDIIILYSEPE